MPSTNSRSAIPQEIESEWTADIWNRIRTHLETKRAQILEDIVNYPPPIPACDQHYNYLLEQRVHLAQELRRLHMLLQDRSASQDELKLIDEFLTASPYIQEEAKQDIRATCQEARSGAKSR
jgi:hypothetical protein